MKRAMHFGLIGWLALAFASPLVAQSFTYQGFLKDSGQPANGIYDFRFRLWTAPSGGVQVGDELYVDDVSVQNGLFTVQLDFGAVWDGSDRYLEILVRLNNAFGYWLLTPRVKITPTPYASFALRPWQTSGSNLFYNDGNVGIGTTTPFARLSLGGGNANTKLAIWQGANTGEVMGLGVGPDQFRIHLHNPNNRFSFLNAPDGTEIMTIRGNGLVGIGTTNPSVRLHLVGSLRVDDGEIQSWGPITIHPDVDNTGDDVVRFVDNAGNTTMIISSTGNVGIGGLPGSDVKFSVYSELQYGISCVASAQYAVAVGGWSNAQIGGSKGVVGSTNSPSSDANGVYGQEPNEGAGHAVYAHGSFAATGTKSFQIDHPLDPENYYLNHFCIEAPEPLNTYSGVVVLDARGEAWVQLPPYFEAINRDPRYTLTPIGAPMPNLHVAVKIQNNRFKIAGGAPGQEVSWEVKAVRNDLWVQRYGYQTEQEKENRIKGKYLNPELYGQPKERGIHYRPELEPTHNKEATNP